MITMIQNLGVEAVVVEHRYTEIDEITQRLDRLCGNTLDVSPYSTREENSRIIA